MSLEYQSYSLPVLTLKDVVIFPEVAIPLSLYGEKVIEAVENALASSEQMIAVFVCKNEETDNPTLTDLYPLGTIASIRLVSKSGPGLQVIIHGLERAEITHLLQARPFLRAQVQIHPLEQTRDLEKEALLREFLELTEQFLALSHPEKKLHFPETMTRDDNVMQLAYPIAKILQLSVDQEQAILNMKTDRDILKALNSHLDREIQILGIRKKMTEKAKSTIENENRKYFLREQIRALQDELGEDSQEPQVDEFMKLLKERSFPEQVKKEVEKEISRLRNIQPASPEYQIAASHIELILELPWEHTTTDNLDLERARQVLDEDHYGLEDVKERIIEHLAVMVLNPEAKAPILCFVGPPGVGKTSLGQSIARALERNFDHFSLGALSDEAELRGHRRTYIGAMPGRLIQAIRRAGAKNPLLMLDEIDKMGRDYRGDPAAALMEILDPAQNDRFHDNYLDLPFDLSRIFFITTANSLESIPIPLLDRMEIVRLSGYSDEEKTQIARRYLFPRQSREAGLDEEHFQITDQALQATIRKYTREAGVRELERMLARLARKVAVRFARGERDPIEVGMSEVIDFLGPERFFAEKLRQELQPGVAIGLAWTESGGDVLYIETISLPSNDKLTLTGHLGEVMKESAMTANSYILSLYRALGIDHDSGPIHIHVPAGAIPKDGPSAGLTMAVALASFYAGKPVRSDTAITGEITLSGLILPVGGIKEKILAARRAGICRVIIPQENKKDLRQLPENVQQDMTFVFAERIPDIIAEAIPDLAGKITSSSRINDPSL